MSTRRTRSVAQSQRGVDRGPNRALQLEEAVLVTTEVVVDTDDGESPFGWRELDPPLAPSNRATRRAVAREARRTK